MFIKEAIEILRKHNSWRRGNDNLKPTNPKLLGEAIDKIITFYDDLPYDIKTTPLLNDIIKWTHWFSPKQGYAEKCIVLDIKKTFFVKKYYILTVYCKTHYTTRSKLWEIV